jgi:HlyD family secretion protein
MTASVDIETDERKGVLSLPIQAVTAKEEEDNDDEFYEVVFVQSADTVIMKTVTTGIQDDEYIEILTGLEEGEVAVVGPYSAVAKKLEQGDKIYEKEEDDEEDDD